MAWVFFLFQSVLLGAPLSRRPKRFAVVDKNEPKEADQQAKYWVGRVESEPAMLLKVTTGYPTAIYWGQLTVLLKTTSTRHTSAFRPGAL